uniref:N-sulphoglucosamine sulphohydrolase C-terminal domain-containing protein n=1 Tax=Knipowitschia caucasica TaxID=637954 RepID=A0AAV2MRH5_KNICA
MLGEIIASLKEMGVLNNTIVIFTADHGELAMDHRQFYKMSMFEGSVHIPLLFMGPDIKSGLLVDQHVSLVDIFPSILNIASISSPANLSGYSLLPFMSKSYVNVKSQHPDWIFSEYHGCNANASTYMLRTGKWKYITYSDGQQVPPQLFDLSQDTEELHNSARDAIKNKEYKEALKHCKDVLKVENNYNAWVFIGLSATELEQPDQAQMAYKKAVELDPEQLLAWQGLANLYQKIDQWDFKVDLPSVYEKLVELYSKTDRNKCYETINKLSEIYESDKEYLKEEDGVDKKETLQLWQQMSKLLTQDGEPKDETLLHLVTAFEQALVHADPVPGEEHKAASVELIKCLSKMPQKRPRLKEACETMASIYPSERYPLEVLCLDYLTTGDFSEEAMGSFTLLQDKHPGSGLAQLGVGFKAFHDGKYKDAIIPLKQGLEKHCFSLGWFSLGQAQLKLHRYSDSVASCSNGLATCKPEDHELMTKLLRLKVEALVRCGGEAAADDALEIFSKVAHSENDPALVSLKGWAYLNKGQVEKALKISTDLLVTTPNLADALALQGRAYFLQKQLDMAEKSFLEAAEKNPESGEYHFLLGELYWNMGVETRIDRSKAHTLLLKLIGVCATIGSVFTAALKAFTKAQQLQPSSIYSLYQAAAIKQTLSKFKEAAAEYMQITTQQDYVPALKGNQYY